MGAARIEERVCIEKTVPNNPSKAVRFEVVMGNNLSPDGFLVIAGF